MPWTPPRTWIPYELVTDSMLNVHVRDNLNAVNRQFDEMVNTTGIGNPGAGNQTLYTTFIPGGMMSVDGDTIVIDAWFVAAANTNAKIVAVSFGGAGFTANSVVAPFTGAAGGGIWLHNVIRRYSATILWANAIIVHPTGILAPQYYAYNMAPGWASTQQVDILVNASLADDLRLFSATMQFRRGV